MQQACRRAPQGWLLLVAEVAPRRRPQVIEFKQSFLQAIFAMSLIEPRTLKGFRDFLPEAMIPRERLIATAQRVYRSFGYSPIDTPALEYFEILSGKGSDETDRQMYHFEDHGGRHVALRFDLTVPLARFAASMTPASLS